MKNKILVFIIGLLVGAILATGGFFIYDNSKSNDAVKGRENRMEMRESGKFDGETPPELPDGENADSSTRPQRPDDNNSNSKKTKSNQKTDATENTENKTTDNV